MRAAASLRTHAINSHDRLAPLAMLVLAMLAAAGVLLPWAEGIAWSKFGWSYDHGLIALAAACEAAIVYGLRASGNINRRRYLAFGLAFALVGLVATTWFYVDVVGSTDPVVYSGQMISYFVIPKVQSAIGLYVSLSAFLGAAVGLVIQAILAVPADDVDSNF